MDDHARGRRALVLVTLLVASGLLGMVPSASAASATLTTDKASYVLGETIRFQLSPVDLTGVTCTPSTATPAVVSVTMDATTAGRIGASGTTQTTFAHTGPYFLNMTVNFPIGGDHLTGSGVTMFLAAISMGCPATAGGSPNPLLASPNVFHAGVNITVDNKPPSAGLTTVFSANDEYEITLASADDVAAATANLAPIGGSTAESFAGSPLAVSEDVPAVTTATPITVTLRDKASAPFNTNTTTTLPGVTGASASAVTGGSVRIQFNFIAAPGASYRIAHREVGGPTWAFVDVTEASSLCGSSSGCYEVSGLDLGDPHEFRVIPVVGSNHGVPSSLLFATPQASPNSITIGSSFSGRIVNNIGPVSGTYTASGTPTLELALLNSAGQFWKNTADGSFQAAEVWHPVTPTSATTWSTNLLATGLGSNIGAVSADGTYTIFMRILAGASNQTDPTSTANKAIFTLDRTGPVKGSATDNRIVTDVSAGVQQGVPFVVRLGFTDAASAVKNVSFQLRYTTPATKPLVAGWDASVLARDVNVPDAASVVGDFPLTFNKVPLGTFELVATAYDLAGNPSAISIYTPTIKFVPRILLSNGALVEDGNSVYLVLLAAYENATRFDGEDCPNDVCKVDNIVLDIRNGNSGSGTTLAPFISQTDHTENAGGLTYWNYTRTHDKPASISTTQPVQVRATLNVRVNPTNAGTITYVTPWTSITTALNPSALAVTYPPADWRVNSTGAINVWARLNLTSSQVPAPFLRYNVLGPLTAGAPDRACSTTLGTQDEANAQGGGITAANARTWNYTIPLTGLAQGVYRIDMCAYTTESAGSGTTVGESSRYFSVQPTAPKVVLTQNATGDGPTTPIEQPGVSRRPLSDGTAGSIWVPIEFPIHLYVNPGAANVSASDVKVQLVRDARPGQKPVLNDTEDGFDVDLLNPQDLAPTISDALLRFNVKLPPPPETRNGDFVSLRISVKNDAADKPDAAKTWTNVTFPLRADLAPPTASVDLVETRLTANVTNGQLRIIGSASDAGSGIADIEIRLVNLNNSSAPTTWNWAANAFQGGERDLWASNRLVQKSVSAGVWARDVGFALDNAGNVLNTSLAASHTIVWSLNETTRPNMTSTGALTGGTQPRLPLDRAGIYRLDVRVRDVLGETTQTSFPVTFDVQPPQLRPPGSSPASAITSVPSSFRVDWHSSVVLTTSIADQHCVRNVSLVGRTDGGRVVGPAPFRPVDKTQVTCVPANAGVFRAWTIDLDDHPEFVDSIDNYTYWVQAVDLSGNVNETPAGERVFRRTVFDSQPAQIPNTLDNPRLEPPTVPAGGASRIVVDVRENHQMQAVYAILYRASGTRATAELGRGLMTPGEETSDNGTGPWAVDSQAIGVSELPLGSYLWQVYAADAFTNVTCTTFEGDPAGCLDANASISCDPRCAPVTASFRVSADAGIFIVQDAPTSATTTVNATPTFRWRVFDPVITASGVRVLAGNSSADLADVPASALSVTDMPLSGTNRTGVNVEYRPTLVNHTTFAARLEATARGFTNLSDIRSYTVDAVAPTAQHVVAGDLEIGGRRYAVPTTLVTLNVTSNETATLSYSVNGGAFVPYTAPFAPTGPDGEWRLEYRATDAAGNAGTGTLNLTLDRTGPVITVTKNGDEVIVTVTDAGVGLDEATVRVHHRYGTEQSFTPVTMQKVTGNTFRAQLTGNATSTGLRYYFEAMDLLDNVGSLHSAVAPYIIEPEGPTDDLPPTLRITSPTPNQAVRGNVELRWHAEDPDGNNVTITLALRTPTGQGRILQTAGLNNGTYDVDMTGQAAGAYTLVVTASDGLLTTQESVVFQVERGELFELVAPVPTQVEPSRLVPLALRINSEKQVANATYTVTRNNETFSTGALRAAQGTYTANIVTGEPGAYKISVAVTYADGSTEPARDVASFEVRSTAPPPGPAPGAFPVSLMTLIVLAVVTIGLAAYAAFMRWPR